MNARTPEAAPQRRPDPRTVPVVETDGPRFERYARLAAAATGAPRAAILLHAPEGDRVLALVGPDDVPAGATAEAWPGAWAAAPIVAPDGAALGVVRVGDVEGREWTAADRAALDDVAAAVGAACALEHVRGEGRRFRELVDDLDAIAWEFDLDTWRFTFVSPAAEKILGYPTERWIEEDGFWEDRVLHPEDRDWAIAFCRDATATGADHEFDYRAVAADGRVVWLKDSVRVVKDRAGRAILLRGIMIDISSEKQATCALARTEEKFRQIAENVREVFWIFDAGFTQAVYVSPAYEELWGRPASELYDDARSFLGTVHPEDQPALAAAMDAVATTPVNGIEYRVVRPDGTLRWAFSRGYPIRDADGKLYRVVGTTEDVTERKETQDRLAAAEAHYRLLVENAPYGIYALDADGRFLELNPAAEAILECEPGEKIGCHFSTVIAPESLEVATLGFERVLSGEADHIEFDEWVLQASGRQRLIRVTESAIRDGDAIVGTHGVARDITDEFHKDRQLRRAERLASIGTLIGGVAHELNNPLQSISAFADMLLAGSRTPEETQDLETIRREALRASRIVSNLRLLARQAQDEPGERVPLDLNDIVRHVLRTRRYALETANIQLVEELAPGLPRVLGDGGQLEQVVLNLVVNAEQSMHGTDERRLVIRTRATDDAVHLSIADTGIGIASGDLEHIFDPFFTTKRPGEGTGLGLSLVYGIVAEHGGDIHVESEPGDGTMLRVELPRAPRSDAVAPGVPARPGAAGQLRVLVVDDEPAIRSALTRYLVRRRGHHVDAASDGHEALRLIQDATTPHDVIVSDLRMPGLGGDQLLERLRGFRAGLEKRVIFLTGDAASGHAARVLAEARVPVLFKPIELSTIADHIEAHARTLT